MLSIYNLLVALMQPNLHIVLIENHQTVVKMNFNHRWDATQLSLY